MKPFFAFWVGGWFTWGYIGAAAITTVGGYLSRPKAAAAANITPTNLQDEQTKSIQGNLASQSGIEALLGRANSFQQDQATSLQEKAMPGYTDLAKSLTNRAQTLADHPYDVPPEVTKNLERLAAERGISAGTRGQFSDFSLLRDFGVNELQYGQSNLSQAQGITGLLATIAPKVNPMSPLSFYTTPGQQAQVTQTNNGEAQAIAQGRNNATTAAGNAGSADLWGSLAKLAGLYATTSGGSKSGGNIGTGSNGGINDGGLT
jgi:hypothetical protein